MGFMGGGKSPKASMPPMAPVPAPKISTMEDPMKEQMMATERANVKRALLSMKGRQSTILTDETIGDPNIKKTSLGQGA